MSPDIYSPDLSITQRTIGRWEVKLLGAMAVVFCVVVLGLDTGSIHVRDVLSRRVDDTACFGTTKIGEGLATL